MYLLNLGMKVPSLYNLCRVSPEVIGRKCRYVHACFQNLDNAWQWVKGLSTGGSTNTLAALKLALADPQCHAIYLLTDGRPDQVQYGNPSPLLSCYCLKRILQQSPHWYSHDGVIKQLEDKDKTRMIQSRLSLDDLQEKRHLFAIYRITFS